MEGWDYGVGWYFVTICTHGRVPWFGDIRDGVMELSDIGWIAHRCWLDIPHHFPHVELGMFIVMPNHVHGIVMIGERPAADVTVVETCKLHVSTNGKRIPRPKPGSLGSIINQYKRACTYKIKCAGHVDFQWQPRFHDRIIRDLDAMNRIREYIWLNPMKWPNDRNTER